MFNATCAVIYPEPAKQKNVIKNIRSKHIPSCFPDGMNIARRKIVVSATSIEPFGDTGFLNMQYLWSKPPWTMIYAGPGLARRAGSRVPLPVYKI